MNIYAHQGDLVFNRLSSPITEPLSKEMDPVLAGTDSGHPHTIRGPVLIFRQGKTARFRIMEATSVVHSRVGGHNPVPLAVGDYEVYPQRERHDGEDREVED